MFIRKLNAFLKIYKIVFLIINKYLIHLGLGAVDMFIDDSNPLNRAIHSSLGNILTLSNT